MNAFKFLCALSIIQFAFGMNVVVRMWCIPRISFHCYVISVQNGVPGSVLSVNGGPNRVIQIDVNAVHTEMDVMSVIGTASNHIVHESINVSKFLGLLFQSAGLKDPLYSY